VAAAIGTLMAAVVSSGFHSSTRRTFAAGGRRDGVYEKDLGRQCLIDRRICELPILNLARRNRDPTHYADVAGASQTDAGARGAVGEVDLQHRSLST
jgi:hypothetical protein